MSSAGKILHHSFLWGDREGRYLGEEDSGDAPCSPE